MKNLFKIALTCICTFSFFTGTTYAADTPITPSGTFTLEIEALTMLSGETGLPVSKGVVTFQGKDYPFTVQALTMGNHFGASVLKASGVLYGMKDISQFESPFHVIGGGIGANQGDQIVTFKNDKGVVSIVHGTLTGPLYVPAQGAVIKLLNK